LHDDKITYLYKAISQTNTVMTSLHFDLSHIHTHTTTILFPSLQFLTLKVYRCWNLDPVTATLHNVLAYRFRMTM